MTFLVLLLCIFIESRFVSAASSPLSSTSLSEVDAPITITLPPIPLDITIIEDDSKLPLPEEGSTFSVVSPLYDTKFKKVFGTPDFSEELMKAFLNDIWGFVGDDEIQELYFLPVARYKDDALARTCFYDVMCIDKAKRRYIIEMQKAKHGGFLNRMFFYSAVELSRQGSIEFEKVISAREIRPRSSVEFYKELFLVKTLVICDFIVFKERKGYIHFADIAFREQPRTTCSDILAWSFIELPKFKVKGMKSNVEKWIAFLNSKSRVRLEKDLISGPRRRLLLRAYWLVNHISPAEQAQINTNIKAMRDSKAIISEAKAEGRVEGEAIGIEKGEARATKRERAKAYSDKLASARKMKDLGMTLSKIAGILELDIDQIAHLF